MEKKIIDYAHLYIGCTVQSYWGTTSEKVTLVGVAEGILIYDFWRDETEVAHSWDATLESEHPDKLLLRPLSSMTEEEIKEVLFIIMDSPVHLDKDSRFTKAEFDNCIDSIEPDDNAIVVHFSLRCIELKLYISEHSGLIRLYDEDDKEQYFEFNPMLFKCLLSKGFDLFGLIEAGLAIDSTKQL